ncbi:MAG: type II toxin-antitoxin system VapC family toxin [Thaumarchaeota archaeon]|nr:type II toxin-antitoxin system VapC family toxin [Nitrososphaerota archaeon]
MVAISERVKEEKNPDKYVIDASALYPMLLRISTSEILEQLSKLTVLDLTKYEIGNTVRYDRSAKDQLKLTELWDELLSEIREERIDDMKLVQEIALKNDLTFYDASYVHVAIRSGSKLVTSDGEILWKFKDVTLDLTSYKEKVLKR